MHINKFLTIGIIQCLLSDNNGIKPVINNRKVTGKFPNTRRLSNTLPNNTWIKEKISREILKYFELNENETIYPSLCDAVKAMLREKFITLNEYIY